MKVIVGLGNPGPEYQSTRHNAGLMLVDRLVGSQLVVHSDYGWRKFYGIYVYRASEVILVKTGNYFMNESGNVMRDILRSNELQTTNYELYVAHDDLDIKLGEYKIQRGKGPKEHNGVLAVEQAMGSKDFWRIRIGIDNREPSYAKASEGEEYVLEKFSPEEKIVLEGVLDAICNSLLHLPLNLRGRT